MNVSPGGSAVRVARWIGRILSILLVGLAVAFAVGEGIPRPLAISPQELALCAALLAMFVGLVAAWRWEDWGGLLIVGGFVVFAITNGGLRLNPLANPLWMFLLAGLLFLFCWWRTPKATAVAIDTPEIDYGKKRKSWFYRIALPAIWLVVALFSWTHPGDEYALFFISCSPAAMLLAPFVNAVHFRGVLPILALGTVIMALAGWLMDTLRVWRFLWIALFILGAIGLTWYGLSQYHTYARAMAKNGSLTAYIAAATNLSLNLSVLVGIPVALFTRLVAPRD